MAASVWKGHISFGLISIPVKLVRAARPDRVSLHQLHRGAPAEAPAPRPEPPPSGSRRGQVMELPSRPALAPSAPAPSAPPASPAEPPAPVERVRQAAIAPGSEEPIPQSEIVKGYEYQPDRWVVLGRDEIKRLAPETSKVMEIGEFVRFDEIDPVYLESSYYVVPERAGEKAYAVLYRAMKEANLAAVADLAMHGREHVVILRPGKAGMVAHTMFFENEVRQGDEHPADASLAGDREVELAKKLVESLATTFQPEKYRDTYREKLEALIAGKLQGGQVAEAQTPPPAKAPVIDLMEALEKSLAAVRKPPASAEPAPPQAKKKPARR